MTILTREQILEKDDLKRELVAVPEWGGEVLVRELTGRERDQYESGIISMKGRKVDLNLQNARAKLVAMAAINEDGTTIFRPKDVMELGKKSSSALERVAEVIQRLSKLKVGDDKTAVANFTLGQIDDSTST